MSEVAVQVLRVTKLYGAIGALRGVTCVLEWGKVTVVRGGNGSGKSTLLGIVGGRIRPTSGHVEYGGGLNGEGGLQLGSIGWVGHDSLCYADLTARQNIEFTARLHGRDEGRAYEEASERFGLGDFGERPVRTYSRGQHQRLSIARALVQGPPLVVFDEPTVGLDAAASAVLARVVREEAGRGAAVVVATHDSVFADRVADRVLQLRAGRTVCATAEESRDG